MAESWRSMFILMTEILKRRTFQITLSINPFIINCKICFPVKSVKLETINNRKYHLCVTNCGVHLWQVSVVYSHSPTNITKSETRETQIKLINTFFDLSRSFFTHLDVEQFGNTNKHWQFRQIQTSERRVCTVQIPNVEWFV